MGKYLRGRSVDQRIIDNSRRLEILFTGRLNGGREKIPSIIDLVAWVFSFDSTGD
jgi:hypothetical protein